MEFGREAVERVVGEHMDAFQEALQERVDLPIPEVATILVVPDGSHQDDLVLALAPLLARRLDARVVLAGALADGAAPSARAYLEEVQERLLARDLRTEVAWAEGEVSFDRILRAREETGADLVVLPAPYLRELETLGEDSVGTNLDVLLNRCPVPILVIRDPAFDAEAVLDTVTLLVFDTDPWSVASAGWALRLARGARLRTLAFVEEEVVQVVRETLAHGGSDEAARRLARGLVPLVSAVLRRCEEEGLGSDADYVVGSLVDLVRERLRGEPTLLVIRGYGARDVPREKVARDLVLQSRVPVLVVKAGATAPPRGQ